MLVIGHGKLKFSVENEWAQILCNAGRNPGLVFIQAQFL